MRRHGRLHRPKALMDIRRRSNADRVGERQFENTLLKTTLGHLNDAFHRHFAVERATKRRRDRSRQAHARRLCRGRHLWPHLERLFYRPAIVADREAIRRAEDIVDLFGAGRNRALHAPQVERERNERCIRALRQTGEHSIAIRHLRHLLRVDETPRFQAPKTRRQDMIDQSELVFG